MKNSFSDQYLLRKCLRNWEKPLIILLKILVEEEMGRGIIEKTIKKGIIEVDPGIETGITPVDKVEIPIEAEAEIREEEEILKEIPTTSQPFR